MSAIRCSLCGRAGRHAAESEQRARRNCRLHRRCSATTWRAPRRTTQTARARKLSRGRTFDAQRHSATPRRLSSCARMGRRCSATLRSRRRYSTRQGWSVTTGTAPYCGAVLLGAHAMPSRGEIASCLRHSDVWNRLEQTGADWNGYTVPFVRQAAKSGNLTAVKFLVGALLCHSH